MLVFQEKKKVPKEKKGLTALKKKREEVGGITVSGFQQTENLEVLREL